MRSVKGKKGREEDTCSDDSNDDEVGIEIDALEPSVIEQEGAVRPKQKGRRKIDIQYIDDKSRRHITFSKRKGGIIKKVPPPPRSACADASGAGAEHPDGHADAAAHLL
jgi:hypothetical protein